MRVLDAVIQGTVAGILACAISCSPEAFGVSVDLRLILEYQI
jgi:hypothetical protein